MIHVFLVSAYATEADARKAVSTMPRDIPYLGVWQTPMPERPVVHAFCHHTSDELEDAGWTKIDQGASDTETAPPARSGTD